MNCEQKYTHHSLKALIPNVLCVSTNKSTPLFARDIRYYLIFVKSYPIIQRHFYRCSLVIAAREGIHLLRAVYYRKAGMRTTRTVLIGFLLIFAASCENKQENQAAKPPPEVKVYQTRAQDVPIFREYVGQILGYKDIAIRARVEGFLEEIHFQEGVSIDKDTLLYTLESLPFEAEVAAQMSRVVEAQTMLVKAENDLKRIEPLAREKAVSERELDAAIAQHDAAIASVEAAQAVLRASEIQLGYTKIYSPVTGIIGQTLAKVGDFVGREPNPIILNTVSSIDTILVQFFISEAEYLRFIREYIARGGKREKKRTLELILSDGSVYEHMGRIDFFGREIDPRTGSLLIQASFDNPDNILRPGQFARIKIQVKVIPDGILIPQRCVMELQGLYSVFTVDINNNEVRNKSVIVGPRIDSFWLIEEGLSANELIVYEGLQKVRNGVIAKPLVHQVLLPPAAGL